MTALLLIIYLSFISLGLPVSILGSAWPIMRISLNASPADAGILSMIFVGSMTVSCLFIERLERFFGTGRLALAGISMIAAALLGYSLTPSFFWLCICSLPLGLGSGMVDAGMNNFVALHCKARYMNWLHCFWGIGATLGPVIMSLFIAGNGNWRRGYQSISILEFVTAGMLILSLGLWKRFEQKAAEPEGRKRKTEKKRNPPAAGGVKISMASFFMCGALELTAGLWGASYMVSHKNLEPDAASRYTALFYAGITAGRFLSGFISMKLNNRNLIRLGQGLCLSGIVLLILPLPAVFPAAAFILMGFGYAPIVPAMIHETPKRFGKEASQSVIGLQMAAIFSASAFMPPLFGFILSKTGMGLFPVSLLLSLLVFTGTSELLNRLIPQLGAAAEIKGHINNPHAGETPG
ncbi:MAG: MFS transporter [Treponema sp.]|jgi:fucose permease|nr:MFS transporter [Treponema sp.]